MLKRIGRWMWPTAPRPAMTGGDIVNRVSVTAVLLGWAMAGVLSLAYVAQRDDPNAPNRVVCYSASWDCDREVRTAPRQHGSGADDVPIARHP